MKKNKLLRVTTAFLLAIYALTVFTSCDDDDPEPVVTTNTITDIVVNGNDFSTLETAVLRTNLAGTLSSAGPFTVFAPDNAAFNTSGLTGAASTLDTATLKKILLYHTLAGERITSSAIPTVTNLKKTTANGDSVFITKTGGNVFVNGVKVKTPDVSADNGIIHVVDRVIVPPAGNIVQTLIADTSFSLLVAAVVKVSGPAPGGTGVDVAALLSGPGIYTVFAPNNTAFRNAGLVDVAAINAQNPTTLLGILAVHVIGNRGFSCDLTNGGSLALPLAPGKNIAVRIAGGVFLKVAAASAESQVIATDKMARNGVIHTIDRILTP
jgi:uncharacterized surface protein with fasciclin (FAS1) repeats